MGGAGGGGGRDGACPAVVGPGRHKGTKAGQIWRNLGRDGYIEFNVCRTRSETSNRGAVGWGCRDVCQIYKRLM